MKLTVGRVCSLHLQGPTGTMVGYMNMIRQVHVRVVYLCA